MAEVFEQFADALLGSDGHEVVPRARHEVGELHLRDRP